MAQSEKGCALFILREGKIKMRLDKFLKVSRLIKRRTVANEACDAGRVLINGAVAKASTKVKKGDILCIIEAMKLMNEIECEFDGEIAEILVKDGEMVEYGKPLFKIK